MNTIEKEYISDQQIDRIVEILQSVPEVPVPEGFDDRLRIALMSEMAHADIRPVTTARSTGFFASRRMRIGMSLAACFVVGILSINMYNSGMWDPPIQPGTELNGSAGTGTTSEAEIPAEEESSPEDVLSDATDGGIIQERVQTNLGEAEEKEEPVSIASAEPEVASPPQQVQIASDPVSRHGGQFAELRDEQILYSALAEKHLNGQKYELDSYTWDLKTGEHRFSLRVWETGTEAVTERSIVLVGARGEIYEEQQPDESIEPLRSD